MSLFGLIAASQRGQCFANLARRLMVRETQVAIATHHLLRALLPALEHWVSRRDGLLELLALMSGDGLERPLISPSMFSNHADRDMGRRLLARLKEVAHLEPGEIRQASLRSGLEDRVLGQMLPYVTLLMLAALKVRSEREFREILLERAPIAMRRSGDTFADLGRMLVLEAEAARRPSGLLGYLTGLIGRRAGSEIARLQPA